MERKYHLNNISYNSELERQDALRVSIPHSKNVITVDNDLVHLSSMANIGVSVPTPPSRFHYIKLGFFGWIIFSNIGILTFFLTFVSFSREFANFIFIGLIFLIAISIIILLWQKKSWVFVGVASALIVNFGLWTIPLSDIIFFSWNPAKLLMFMIIPFPLGFLVFRS